MRAYSGGAIAAASRTRCRAVTHANLADALLVLGDTVGAIESLEDFLARNTDPGLAGLKERQLAALRAATRPAPLDSVPPVIIDTGLIQFDTAGVRRD